MILRRAPLAGLIVGLAIGAWGESAARAAAPASATQTPFALSNEEFWRLTAELSEPNGFFRSDNLVSDELLYRDAVPALEHATRFFGVPVVGSFAGPKALRAIGDYVRSQKTVVTAFYLSEVEPYLQESGQMPAFYANLATLPVTASSVLIRPPTVSIPSAGASFSTLPISPTPVLVPIASEVKTCTARSGGLSAGRSFQ